MGKHRNLIFLILLIAGFTVMGCSDGATDSGEDSDDPTPPSVPQMEQMSPDTEYFEENSSSKLKTDLDLEEMGNAERLKDSDAQVFDQAAQEAVMIGEIVNTLGFGFSTFFSEIDEDDYSYDDGVFIWEFSLDEEDFDEVGSDFGSVTINVEAEPNSSETEAEWRLLLTDEENDMENELVMDGTSSYDGSEGEWNIYGSESSSEGAMEYEWSIDDEDNLSTTFSINDDEFGSGMTISYEEDGPERQLSMDAESEDVPSVDLYWNEDTDEGYYEAQGIRLCWDSNFENTTCPDDGSGEDYEGEVPEFPMSDFDFSFFEDNIDDTESLAFEQAKDEIETYIDRIRELESFPREDLRSEFNEYLQNNEEEYSFSEGVLSWNLASMDSDGIPFELVLEAEPDEQENEAHWELLVTDSYEFDEDMVMSVTTNFEASEWTEAQAYGYGDDGNLSDEPILEYEQQVDGDGIVTGGKYSLKEMMSENDSVTDIVYTTDGSENWYDIENTEMELEIEIYWDEETNEGYIETFGDRMCWDENLEDTTCE